MSAWNCLVFFQTGSDLPDRRQARPNMLGSVARNRDLHLFLAHLLHLFGAFWAAKVARFLSLPKRADADDDHGGAGTGATDQEVRTCHRRRWDKSQDSRRLLLLSAWTVGLRQDLHLANDCRP